MGNVYKWLPFWYRNIADDKFVIVGQSGNHLIVDTNSLKKIIDNCVNEESDLFFQLKNRQIIASEDDFKLQVELTANQLRTRKSFLKADLQSKCNTA